MPERCFPAHNLTAELGYLDYQDGGFGQGRNLRLTISRFVLSDGRHFPSFEPGLGISYFKMTEIDRPPGYLAPPANMSGDLSDYFFFFSAKYNFPVSTSAAFYAGGRIGIHIADWHFRGTMFDVKDKYEALGLDILAGLKLQPPRLPLGVQMEIGTVNPFEDVGQEVPFALGISGGIYLKL